MPRTRCGCCCSCELLRPATSIVTDLKIDGCELLRSATSMVTDLKIHGYSLTKVTPTGNSFDSDPFNVGGHRWRIRFFPNGPKPEYEGFLSFFLSLDERVGDPVKAQFRFCFVNNVEEKPITLEAVPSFASYKALGNPEFIKREELEKSEHLKDDSFTVRCNIVVINEVRAKLDTAAVGAPPTRSRFVSVPPSDLHRNLGDLLLSEKGADVVFDVGGQTFAAHRCVLAARSPVFSAELLGTMKESNTACVVRVDDMEAQVFKALLYFVYTDSLPKAEEREAGEEEDDSIMSQHLLVAADRYSLERLKLICEDKLCGHIEVGTAANILTLAEQHNCHGLKKACFDFLSVPANLRKTKATDGFKHLSRSCPDVMVELIAMLAI